MNSLVCYVFSLFLCKLFSSFSLRVSRTIGIIVIMASQIDSKLYYCFNWCGKKKRKEIFITLCRNIPTLLLSLTLKQKEDQRGVIIMKWFCFLSQCIYLKLSELFSLHTEMKKADSLLDCSNGLMTHVCDCHVHVVLTK